MLDANRKKLYDRELFATKRDPEQVLDFDGHILLLLLSLMEQH